MNTEPRTVEQWLSYGDELPVELAEVLTPEPWKHEFYQHSTSPLDACKKCHCGEDTIDENCPVPDPITIDWNTAMEYRDEIFDANHKSRKALGTIIDIETESCAWDIADVLWWWARHAQPKHYLIAAAMAMDRSKE